MLLDSILMLIEVAKINLLKKEQLYCKYSDLVVGFVTHIPFVLRFTTNDYVCSYLKYKRAAR
jgi:hypothetical protein